MCRNDSPQRISVLRSLALLTVVARITLAAASGDAAIFTVNSVGDGGDLGAGDGLCDTGSTITTRQGVQPECTLRAAIEEANFTSNFDTIRFGTGLLPDSNGAIVIAPPSDLPWITSPLDIDGRTASGYDGTGPVVTLEGTGQSGKGLHILASGSTVQALSVVGFSEGITVNSASGVTIHGCFAGWI